VREAFLVYLGELDLAGMGVDEGKIPENPAPVLWAMYHQMERWHQLPSDGGLLNQFYILMAELEVLDQVVCRKRQQSEQIAQAQQEQIVAFQNQMQR